MRLALPIVVLLCASTRAAPQVTWTEWVGDYTGKLAWTGCSSPGAKSATLSIDAVDGALAIELAPAGGGLRALSLVEDPDSATMSAQQGEVTLALARPRPETIELAIDLSSGCAIRGKLVRASIKIPACDRLAALARIEGKCTKLPGAPKAPPQQRWKAKDAARCTTSADAIEAAVIDAGCLPVADPVASALSPQCRQVISDAEKLKRCPTAPPDYVQIANRVIALAQPAATATERSVVDARCYHGHQMLVELAAYVHCPL